MDALEVRSAEPTEENDTELTSAVDAVNELRSAVDEHRTQTDARITEELRRIGERVDALDVRTQRPNGRTDTQNNDNAVERRAFNGFIRHGRESLPADEVRTLRVAENQAGGYFAPEEFEAAILKELVEVSPVRSAATVRPTSSASVVQPRRTGRISARWVGEVETRPATEPSYGQIETPVHEMACYVDVSNQLLEDSAVNIEGELSVEFATEFGRLEGEAFVIGDGFKKPSGIMADTAVSAVLNGHATNLRPDALISLMYDLPAQYRNRGVWMMTGATIAAVRTLKDGQSNYLWQPSYQAGQPETLLGRPIVEAVDMADVAANAFPILYGDVAAAYRIFDRVGLSVMRDPYTQATNGITRFHARRRVGGAVIRPEALRKLRMATS
ncbi:MAG: phage major capsid protein [Pseudomonadota bacterium]